jgi:hypothetical protein
MDMPGHDHFDARRQGTADGLVSSVRRDHSHPVHARCRREVGRWSDPAIRNRTTDTAQDYETKSLREGRVKSQVPRKGVPLQA